MIKRNAERSKHGRSESADLDHETPDEYEPVLFGTRQVKSQLNRIKFHRSISELVSTSIEKKVAKFALEYA
jgi:hypothetical protein